MHEVDSRLRTGLRILRIIILFAILFPIGYILLSNYYDFEPPSEIIQKILKDREEERIRTEGEPILAEQRKQWQKEADARKQREDELIAKKAKERTKEYLLTQLGWVLVVGEGNLVDPYRFYRECNQKKDCNIPEKLRQCLSRDIRSCVELVSYVDSAKELKEKFKHERAMALPIACNSGVFAFCYMDIKQMPVGKAQMVLKKLCEHNWAQGCYALGFLEFYDNPEIKDRVWNKACDLNPVFCREIADKVRFSFQGTETYKLGEPWFKRGCEKGDRLSCKEAGLVPRALYQDLCDEKKSFLACFRAGVQLSYDQDFKEAAKYLGKACENARPSEAYFCTYPDGPDAEAFPAYSAWRSRAEKLEEAWFLSLAPINLRIMED